MTMRCCGGGRRATVHGGALACGSIACYSDQCALLARSGSEDGTVDAVETRMNGQRGLRGTVMGTVIN